MSKILEAVVTPTLAIKVDAAELTLSPVTLDKAEVSVYSVAADVVAKTEASDEYEFLLKEKPTSNVFTIPFTSKECVFYYQPPLTEELDPAKYDSITESEAWKDGKRVVYRPPNVVGSYAVFQTNPKLGTGKILHLYRPYATDANGAGAWVTLEVKADAIVYTVPQKFLDTAVYPVRF